MTSHVSIGSPTLYLVFGVVVSIMILIDMFALKASGDHKVSAKEALIWTIIWITVALIFDLGLWAYIKYMLPAENIPATLGNNSSYAIDKALEFLTGYVVEKSLSIDNIFIFLLIFSYFKVPNIYQRRVLVYGVLAAVFLRVVMVLIGSYLISRFEWILYFFGAFLLFTGIKMCFGHDEEAADLSNNKIVKLTKKFFKTTDEYHKEHFFILKDGIRYATPLFIVLVLITISDIIFAVDSVPAVFAVTTDPFIVMTSNVFAILGLRAMYFLLADMAERFYLLQYGLAIILIFIGIKMLILYFDYHFPTALSLSVILGTLVGSIVLSLLFPKKDKVS